jgi:ornithine cyclodeaminase
MNSKLITTSDIEVILLRTGLEPLLDQLIERLREGFARLDMSTAMIPARTGIQYFKPDLGLLEWMPAAVGSGKATLKLVGYHPSNPVQRRLPTILSTLCVFDTTTGHLSGIMDGTFATALRTGAMSAIATDALAERKDSCLGIVGCGAQAVTQCHALSRVLPIRAIVAYDRDPLAAASFGKRIGFLGIPVKTVDASNLFTLLESADVLCTCTSEAPGNGPLFADFKNKPGLHINAVGSDFPNKFELPVDLLRRSFVCPDFRAQALVEGECQQLMPEAVTIDLSELLRAPDLQRSLRSELTVFDSTGHAYADYVAGLLFLEYAESMGLGTDVDLECAPPDPKDPYSFLNKPEFAEFTSRTADTTSH